MLKRASIVIASFFVASSAFAAPQYSATLAAAVSKRIDVIVDSNLFRCEGTTCQLVSKPIDAGSVSVCRKLARKVGEIKAYGTEADQFDADELARCNAK